MNKSREFYIQDDGIRIHMKLDLPEMNCVQEGAQSYPASERACRPCPDHKLPLMILIHGFTGHMEETHILAARDAAIDMGFAVLRAEMYGHGLSGGEFGDHTLFKWMSNAMAVIDYAGTLDFVSDLYMCGHSQGGLLTMLVGAMERDRLKALLELSPASMIPEMARRGELLGVPFDPQNLPHELDAGKSLMIRDNYIRAAQLIDVDLAIAGYTGPVLVVHGTEDASVPYRCSEEIVKKYADARLISIQGDTHCYDYHLDQVSKAIREFLREMSA